MALLNRKQVPLCKDCHRKVHAGLYDGPSLETLRKNMRKEIIKKEGNLNDNLLESRMQ